MSFGPVNSGPGPFDGPVNEVHGLHGLLFEFITVLRHQLRALKYISHFSDFILSDISLEVLFKWFGSILFEGAGAFRYHF